MKRVINGLILTLFALPIFAQEDEPERWYEVEIILFEHTNPVAIDSEEWPLEIIEPDLSNSIGLIRSLPEEEPVEEVTKVEEQVQPEAMAEVITSPGSPADTTVPYLVLPPEQYQLSEAYQKLANSENYLPHVHVAWRQIIPPRKTPDRIFIHDQLNVTVDDELIEDESEQPIEDVPPATASENFSDDMFIDTLLDFTPPAHALSGILSIGVGRYLHVEADLLLYKPQLENTLEEEEAPPAIIAELEPPLLFADEEEAFEPVIEEEQEQTPEFFRIQGNLRMRSKEVHYLDHPLVGMLILFTPYTPPEPEVTDELSGEELNIQEHVDINQPNMTPTPQ